MDATVTEVTGRQSQRSNVDPFVGNRAAPTVWGTEQVAQPDCALAQSRPGLGRGSVHRVVRTITALGTDIVVGAAPAAKSGSAAALSETAQELCLAVGVALLGSLAAVLYGSRIAIPDQAPPEATEQVAGSLSGALAVADQVHPEVVAAAREVFTSGVNIASGVAGLAIAAATVLCLVSLRHVRPLGRDRE